MMICAILAAGRSSGPVQGNPVIRDRFSSIMTHDRRPTDVTINNLAIAFRHLPRKWASAGLLFQDWAFRHL